MKEHLLLQHVIVKLNLKFAVKQ